MKLIFIDEFKPAYSNDGNKVAYGVSLVLIDSANYSKYKCGFETEFEKLGWSKDEELKGRHVYSKKIFDNISVEKRLSFAEGLFKLSLSESGKTKRISVYVSFDVFDKSKDEASIYVELLSRCLKKIGKPQDKTISKNVAAFFLDSNDSVASNINDGDLCEHFSNQLHKDWVIFEMPFFVKSSNYLPGIVFADFISFFHQNYIDTQTFFNKTKERYLDLLAKADHLSSRELEELNRFRFNIQKNETSLRVMAILKEIVYVK